MDNIFTKIINFIRYDIPCGIGNLTSYFKIIWEDRDWDSHFLFALLRFKLKRMEQLNRFHGHAVSSIEIADKIKVCVLLLDRIVKDEYEERVFEKHDKKWGDINLDFSDSGCINITRKNVKTKEDHEKEWKEHKALWERSAALKQQDIDLLFKIMSKHATKWWD